MDADDRFERVRAAIEQLGSADHVCTLYDQRDEEAAIAVSYVRTGLERSELCVCVVDDGGKNILDALASEGIDPYYVAPERYLSPDWPLHEADWMMTNLEQLQQAQDRLQASQERYRALSRRLLEQQEHVRASLARELHDQLGQSMLDDFGQVGALRMLVARHGERTGVHASFDASTDAPPAFPEIRRRNRPVDSFR